jgi:hypothetical protein
VRDPAPVGPHSPALTDTEWQRIVVEWNSTTCRPAWTSRSRPVTPAFAGPCLSMALKLRRMAASDAADTRKLAASKNSRSAGDMSVTSTPARIGPKIWPAEFVAMIRPLAATRSSRPTRLGIAAN